MCLPGSWKRTGFLSKYLEIIRVLLVVCQIDSYEFFFATAIVLAAFTSIYNYQTASRLPTNFQVKFGNDSASLC